MEKNYSRPIFVVIDPAVQKMRGGYTKMFYDYIVENEIPHEINTKVDHAKGTGFDTYYINSWGNISLFVGKVVSSTNSYPSFRMDIHPSVFWSRTNKQNTFYTVEEWVNIICGANSADLESRMLSVSLIKNADSSCLTLVKFVLNLISKHEIDKDNYNLNLLFSMYKKNNISQELNLEYYISLLSSVKGSSLVAEKVLADPRILGIFLYKYRHWIDFSNLKIKSSYE